MASGVRGRPGFLVGMYFFFVVPAALAQRAKLRGGFGHWSFVVDQRLSPQLGRLLLRRRITQKTAPAHLRTCQIFQQVRLAQRRVKLDVKMETLMGLTVRRSLMKDHHVRKRYSPEVVKPDQHLSQNGRQIMKLCIGKTRQA